MGRQGRRPRKIDRHLRGCSRTAVRPSFRAPVSLQWFTTESKTLRCGIPRHARRHAPRRCCPGSGCRLGRRVGAGDDPAPVGCCMAGTAPSPSRRPRGVGHAGGAEILLRPFCGSPFRNERFRRRQGIGYRTGHAHEVRPRQPRTDEKRPYPPPGDFPTAPSSAKTSPSYALSAEQWRKACCRNPSFCTRPRMG